MPDIQVNSATNIQTVKSPDINPKYIYPNSCFQYQIVTLPSIIPNFPSVPIPIYSFTKSAGFKTLISNFENGAEQRRNKWSRSKLQFSLSYDLLSPSNVLILWNYYQCRKGSFEAFPYYDPITTTYYSVRFAEDNLSFDQFAKNISRTGIKLIQVF